MNPKDVSSLLIPPFRCLQTNGKNASALRIEGKQAIIDFDKQIKDLSLECLRDLYLYLEKRDIDELELYTIARHYGNHVMLPRLAANIIFKINGRLQEKALSLFDIALLGLEILGNRLTWTFESTSRIIFLRTLFQLLGDEKKYSDQSTKQATTACLRKIFIASPQDFILLKPEIAHLQLHHLFVEHDIRGLEKNSVQKEKVIA